MDIESVEVPRDAETEGALVFRGHLLRPSHVLFPRWLQDIQRQRTTRPCCDQAKAEPPTM